MIVLNSWSLATKPKSLSEHFFLFVENAEKFYGSLCFFLSMFLHVSLLHSLYQASHFSFYDRFTVSTYGYFFVSSYNFIRISMIFSTCKSPHLSMNVSVSWVILLSVSISPRLGIELRVSFSVLLYLHFSHFIDPCCFLCKHVTDYFSVIRISILLYSCSPII